MRGPLGGYYELLDGQGWVSKVRSGNLNFIQALCRLLSLHYCQCFFPL